MKQQVEMWEGLRRPSPPSADSDEWYTPPSVFGPLDREFRFTLDVCATLESTKCERYYNREQDGLSQCWAPHRAWCNPPYSDIEPWVEKAVAEHALGTLVVMLLPCWTDRAWWHRWIEPHRLTRGCPELRFWKGRIKFGYPGNPLGVGRKTLQGFDPSVVVIWRSHV